MITAILPISYRGGFDNLKRNVVNIAADLRNNNLLCIVSDKNLYLECKEFLHEYFNDSECLVVYSERQYPLRESLDYLGDKNEFVFVANENLYLPPNAILKLYNDFLQYPKAGFIAGHFTEYPVGYWVDDIYSRTPKVLYSNEKELESIQEVDIILPPFGLLTKTNNFKELFFRSVAHNGNYGLALRRQGYTNYVDTSIKFRYGTEVTKE